MTRRILAAAFLLALGCKPHPKPQPPADSTAADTATAVDSSDTVLWDRDEVDTMPPVSGPFPESHTLSARPGGLGMSMYNYPKSLWCTDKPINGAAINVLPKDVVKVLKSAAACGMRIQIVTPRSLITTTGRPGAPLSMTRAKASSKAYADFGLVKACTVDYRRACIGINLGDDYGCASCWGGKIVTQAEMYEWGSYARSVLPGVPLGLRVEPMWARKDPRLGQAFDYTNCQYRTKKGDLATYLNRCQTDAQAIGLKVTTGQNFSNCSVAGDSPPCTNTQLRTFITAMVKHPVTCSVISWWYDGDYPRAEPVWKDMARLAATYPQRWCGKGEL